MSGRGFIAVEKDRVCSVCGAKAECRPYGKDGADICHPCGMKEDPEEVKRRMHQYLFGPGGK